MSNRRERLHIVVVDDKTRDLVRLVGNKVLDQEHLERDIGERHLRSHPFLIVCRRNACEIVA